MAGVTSYREQIAADLARMRGPRCVAFQVDLPPRELSPNRRGSLWVYRRAAQQYRADCYFALCQQRGTRFGAAIEHADLSVFVLVPRLRPALRDTSRYLPQDDDNALAALKPARDALVDARLLVTDDSRHLRIKQVAIVPVESGGGCVVLTLEERL